MAVVELLRNFRPMTFLKEVILMIPTPISV